LILVDANLLLYAYDSRSPRHADARTWLEAALSARQPVRFPLVTLLAFVRMGSHPRVFTEPLDPEEALAFVSSWLARPDAGIAEPTDRHWQVFGRMLRDGQAAGAKVTDAHLAALAVEHGGVLCTTDRDFGRFPGLRFLDPLPSG